MCQIIIGLEQNLSACQKSVDVPKWIVSKHEGFYAFSWWNDIFLNILQCTCVFSTRASCNSSTISSFLFKYSSYYLFWGEFGIFWLIVQRGQGAKSPNLLCLKKLALQFLRFHLFSQLRRVKKTLSEQFIPSLATVSQPFQQNTERSYCKYLTLLVYFIKQLL